MSRTSRISLATLAFLTGTTAAARAADLPDIRSPDPRFAIGAGAGFAPDYEGSNDYEPIPVWIISFENFYHPETYVRLVGPRLESNFLPDDHFRLGLVGQYYPDYDDVEDSAVEDISRTEDALQMGVVVGYDFSTLPRTNYILDVTATYDVLNGNGALFTPRARMNIPLAERWSLGASIAATWADGDYMTNRFGVSVADALSSGLPVYDADSGFKDMTLNVALSYAWTQNWSITTFGSYRRMLDNAADSPIVDDRGSKDNFTAAAFISYRF